MFSSSVFPLSFYCDVCVYLLRLFHCVYSFVVVDLFTSRNVKKFLNCLRILLVNIDLHLKKKQKCLLSTLQVTGAKSIEESWNTNLAAWLAQSFQSINAASI